MRRTKTILTLVVAFALTSGSVEMMAQGRGHQRGHDHYGHRGTNSRYDDRRDNHGDRHATHYNRRHERYDRHHHHGPVVVHRHTRPRYVYYRDYDVYYDCNKSVYISYSGSRWTMSASIPVVMRHVNPVRATAVVVQYYHDDSRTTSGGPGQPTARFTTVGNRLFGI